MTTRARLVWWMTPAAPGFTVAVWRIAVGACIACFTAQMWPYIDEQFTTSGLQLRDTLSHFGMSGGVVARALSVVVIVGALCIAAGRGVAPMAACVWLASMALWQQNVLSRSPEMSLVHLSLLLLAICPLRAPRWPVVSARVGLPPIARALAWGAFAVVYSTSGFTKLTYHDASWTDGSALHYVFNASVFRRLWFGDLLSHPQLDALLNIGTRASLALEAGAIFLVWFHRGRCVLWVASLCMHVLALLFLNLTEVSMQMLVFHLLLLDQRMIDDARRLLLALRMVLARTIAVTRR